MMNTILPALFTLTLTGMTKPEGQVFIAIYDQGDAWLDERATVFQKIIPIQSTEAISVDLSELPDGVYGISCFHDENGNGKLDKNFLGIPTEPYGFSNNARPKFRAPRWKEAAFKKSTEQKGLIVRLESW